MASAAVVDASELRGVLLSMFGGLVAIFSVAFIVQFWMSKKEQVQYDMSFWSCGCNKSFTQFACLA